ncbi:MAG: NifU family protein [Acidobacteriota bacterium]|nr:NifU family protein [Acidobacteriota bacterium]
MPTTDPRLPAAAHPAVLAVTPEARAVVLEARAGETDAESLALWVEVAGTANGAYTYDIYFQAAADASGDDAVADEDGLPVVVPESSVARVRGARLDFSEEGEGGLVILNPNTPPSAERAVPETAELSSDLAQRIIAVLESEVNPSIAMHGGRADLVGVDELTAYLELSGGCQGCGLARVTLSQGIEVALREAVPELVAVVDVTDHAGGTNPYFESAKK